MAYIPTTDALLISWGRNYSNLLTDAPATYGLEAADALIVQTQFDIFDASYDLAIAPETRTIVAVADKDGEKLTFLRLARLYAAIIRANQGVTDEDKTALGLNIPDLVPTPVPPPTTYPEISVVIAGSGMHQLLIVDQLTPTSKAKPFGVAGCLLFATSSPTADPSMTNAPLKAVITRADTALDISEFPIGSHVGYKGTWFNRKGELGPEGPPTFFIRA